MATATTTTYDYLLKVRYSDDVIKWMSYRDNPLFAKVKKRTDFDGKNFTFACQYSAGGTGRSAAFSTAQTNAASGKGEDFVLTRVSDYAVARINTETILASKSNQASFKSALQDEMDKAIYRLVRSMAIGMYGVGDGALGTVDGTDLTTTTLTLTNADDITNFETGMRVVFAANNASALRDSGEVLTVSSVNLDAGTMVMSAAVSTIASIADADSIFAEGDYTAANNRNKITGLAGWLPASAPSGSESFFGVDRSVDTARLGGHRLTGTGKAVDEAIYDVAVRIARDGGRPDCAFVSFGNFGNLVTLLGAKVNYMTHKVGDIGFQAIRIHGPKGPIDVFPDQNCPSNVAYVLTTDTWCLKSLGNAPQIIDLGGKFDKISDADGIEIRVAFFGNMYCNAPGWNGRTSL